MSYSQETLNLEQLKQINQALVRGNKALEQLPIKNQKIKTLNTIIKTQDTIIDNQKIIIGAKDQQIRLIGTERDSYRNSAQNLNQQNLLLTSSLQKELKRKKNWRTFSIGSTTVAVGAIVFILLK